MHNPKRTDFQSLLSIPHNTLTLPRQNSSGNGRGSPAFHHRLARSVSHQGNLDVLRHSALSVSAQDIREKEIKRQSEPSWLKPMSPPPEEPML